jgi:hypothetical protein
MTHLELRDLLMEELDAWNPKWRQVCSSVKDASEKAGVLELFERWRASSEGQKHQRTYAVPDRVGESRRAAELQRSTLRRFQQTKPGR